MYYKDIGDGKNVNYEKLVILNKKISKSSSLQSTYKQGQKLH